MKISNKYQKNFDAISEIFWRFWKKFVKYYGYKGNSRIDLRNVWWKFQENFREFLDRLASNLLKKKSREVLGDFNGHPINVRINFK